MTSSVTISGKNNSSLSAKKRDSMLEPGAESELYAHGDSVLRERLQRAEEVAYCSSLCL